MILSLLGLLITWLKVYSIVAAKTRSRHCQGKSSDSLEYQSILMGRELSPTRGEALCVCSKVLARCFHPCHQMPCTVLVQQHIRKCVTLQKSIDEGNMLTHICKAWNYIGLWLSTLLWLFKEVWTKADFKTICCHTVCKLMSVFWSLTISDQSLCVPPVVHTGMQHTQSEIWLHPCSTGLWFSTSRRV